MVKSILIDHDDERPGRFRATASLAATLADLPGVSGGATEEGPWVRAYGGTAPEALRNLLNILGELVCHLCLSPGGS